MRDIEVPSEYRKDNCDKTNTRMRNPSHLDVVTVKDLATLKMNALTIKRP